MAGHREKSLPIFLYKNVDLRLQKISFYDASDIPDSANGNRTTQEDK